ncbi:MAG: phosphoethanolamine transferase, partial [Alistipes sp.]|nr:phosphoethanolamine transferase [Alistipes sp.]
MVKTLKQTKSITLVSAVLSIYTLLAFHYPLFRTIVENLEGGLNGVIITVGFAALMLATNFMIYNLLLYLTRSVGKWIIAFTLVGDAIMLYFV